MQLPYRFKELVVLNSKRIVVPKNIVNEARRNARSKSFNDHDKNQRSYQANLHRQLPSPKTTIPLSKNLLDFSVPEVDTSQYPVYTSLVYREENLVQGKDIGCELGVMSTSFSNIASFWAELSFNVTIFILLHYPATNLFRPSTYARETFLTQSLVESS